MPYIKSHRYADMMTWRRNVEHDIILYFHFCYCKWLRRVGRQLDVETTFAYDLKIFAYVGGLFFRCETNEIIPWKLTKSIYARITIRAVGVYCANE